MGAKFLKNADCEVIVKGHAAESKRKIILFWQFQGSFIGNLGRRTPRQPARRDPSPIFGRRSDNADDRALGVVLPRIINLHDLPARSIHLE